MQPSLIIARDRAHVRELSKKFRYKEIISASAFFDKVRTLAFIYDAQLRRDDHAPLLLAQDILSQKKNFPLLYARNFVTLYSSFFHGTKTPRDLKNTSQRYRVNLLNMPCMNNYGEN
ncbi:MAG: hypothetical protein H6731_08430 [Myxococcales bacterium]|nr:MAG: hypothetical protein H6731_08430 [Myxococcales bacterium]